MPLVPRPHDRYSSSCYQVDRILLKILLGRLAQFHVTSSRGRFLICRFLLKDFLPRELFLAYCEAWYHIGNVHL